jgi:four helix bundle protein
VAENVLKIKSYEFAIEIVKISEQITSRGKEFILSKQLLISGTAFGPLAREAEFTQSRSGFINKMSIALKEANEILYWLNLLKDANYTEDELFHQLSDSCKELIFILVASIKTSKPKK